MKRMISIGLIVLLLGFLLASCGSKEPDETTEPVRETEAIADVETAPATAPSEEADTEPPATTIPQTEPIRMTEEPTEAEPVPTETEDAPAQTQPPETEEPEQEENELPMVPLP